MCDLPTSSTLISVTSQHSIQSVCPTSPLFLPRVCLVRAFMCLFNLNKNIPVDIKVAAIIKHLAHYGCVSLMFRSAVVEAAAHSLSRMNPVFELPFHSDLLSWLRRTLSSHPFNPTIFLDECDLDYPSLLQSTKSLIITANYPLPNEPVFVFPNVQELRIVSTVHQQHITILSIAFPMLKKLSVVVNANLFVRLMFPNLDRLSFLELIDDTFENMTGPIVDVSNLINLKSFSCDIFNAKIVGLTHLIALQNLDIRRVESLDSFHPFVKLKRLSLYSINRQCLELLAGQHAQNSECNLTLLFCEDVPSTLWSMYTSNLTKLALGYSKATEFCHAFNTEMTPLLEQLIINASFPQPCHLFDCAHLNSLCFISVPFQLRVHNLLYVQQLKVNGFEPALLLPLLCHLPYLNSLVVESFAPVDSEMNTTPCKLEYLEYLHLHDDGQYASLVEPLLSHLLALPRLAVLSLSGVKDFSSYVIHGFPLLQWLILDRTSLRFSSNNHQLSFTRLRLSFGSLIDDYSFCVSNTCRTFLVERC
ncbi:hypothetical protein RCL1_008708 [Eukaryota sp. TZLM3-RCL]